MPKYWPPMSLLEKMQEWHKEGREMPQYVYERGKPHLYWLFTGEIIKGEEHMPDEWLEIFDVHERVVRQLDGPYGWAIYQMLLIKRRESDARLQINTGEGRLVQR